MKRKFKPGDVVEIAPENLTHSWSKWFVRLNGQSFIVDSEAVDEGWHLLRMDGKKIRWVVRLYGGTRERGVWEGWLERNEFLTAVHKAQKRAKTGKAGTNHQERP